MLDLTIEQIRDAQANDLDAYAAVNAATESLVGHRAYKLAGGDVQIREDLEQIGRIAVWQALSTFTGTNPGEFMNFIDRKLSGAMNDERRRLMQPGVSDNASKMFERAMRLAEGDVALAMEVAQDAGQMGGPTNTLSADLAYAARLAYQGNISLDSPVRVGDNFVPLVEALDLTDAVIAEVYEVPEDTISGADRTKALRKQEIERVRTVLSAMGRTQAVVLSALTGIEPVGYYGPEADADLCAEYGWAQTAVVRARSRGKIRFRDLYEAAYGAPHDAGSAMCSAPDHTPAPVAKGANAPVLTPCGVQVSAPVEVETVPREVPADTPHCKACSAPQGFYRGKRVAGGYEWHCKACVLRYQPRFLGRLLRNYLAARSA